MLTYFGTAILLGLSAAAPLGPVNLEIMRRGLRGGFQPAFLVGLGAATLDGLYSIVFTLGFTALPSTAFREALGWSGAGVLIILGLQTIRSAWRPEATAQTQPDGGESSARSRERLHPNFGAYLVGFAMTATNPMTLVFWASVGATLGQFPVSGISGKLLLAAGVVFGALLWVLSFATLLHWMQHRISKRVQRTLAIAGGLGIFAFGIRLLLVI